MKTNRFSAFLIVLILLISGCAAPEAKLRFVWPLPPDDPKIEYLGVYNNQRDIQLENYFTKYITGGDDIQFVLINPQMAAGDGNGRVYVTDIKLGAVVIFDFNTGKVSMLGGEDAAGQFGQPTGIAIDSDGFIYVGDSEKRKILIFTKDGKPFANIDLSKELKSIGFIAIDKQRKRLAVPDPKGHKILVVSFKGDVIATITNSDHPEGGFNRPNSAAVMPNGDILVADTFNARVVLFTPEGKFISKFGVRGDNQGQFNLIQGIATDSSGNIYITDARANRFSIMNTKGDLLLAVGAAGDSLWKIGAFQIPFGISIDQNDTIYIVEKLFGRFQKYQYVSPGYLAKNPFKPETLAKPLLDEKKDTKKITPKEGSK